MIGIMSSVIVAHVQISAEYSHTSASSVAEMSADHTMMLYRTANKDKFS